MSRYHDYDDDGGWPPYVSAAERRLRAVREAQKLRKKGSPVEPVVIEGRRIASTFWGKAWCDNMESYRDFESRLPRGRSYARNGSVLDLQIAPGKVAALVSGSSLYRVAIDITQLSNKKWEAIRADCAGGIDSLVELLQGKLSKAVMERLCRQDAGLFPRPSEIRFSCTCPDFASMCKHVAAALYGVGARLDHKPELLFRLRAVNETELVADIDVVLPVSRRGTGSGKILEGGNLSALFGLEMAARPAVEQASSRGPSSRGPSSRGALSRRPTTPGRRALVAWRRRRSAPRPRSRPRPPGSWDRRSSTWRRAVPGRCAQINERSLRHSPAATMFLAAGGLRQYFRKRGSRQKWLVEQNPPSRVTARGGNTRASCVSRSTSARRMPVWFGKSPQPCPIPRAGPKLASCFGGASSNRPA